MGTDDIAPSLHGEKVIVSKKSSHGVGTGVLVMTVSSPFYYSCVPSHEWQDACGTCIVGLPH